MFLQRQDIAQYSPETIEAIKKATAGKEQILWDTEQAIVTAITADTQLTLLQKASEITRSMNRFISSVQGINGATMPYPVYGDMGYLAAQQHPFNMQPGMQAFTPNDCHVQNTMLQLGHTSYLTHTDDAGRDVNNSLAINGIDNKIDNIVLAVDGFALPLFSVGGVLNGEPNEGIGIAVIVPTTLESVHVQPIFDLIMETLELTDQVDKYSYTTRAVDAFQESAIYIDLANNDDPVEIENFNDIVKGYFNKHIQYDKLFPAAA